MTFSWEGATWRIRFEYLHRGVGRRAKRVTSCLIEQGHWPKGMDRPTWVVASQGEALCSRRDPFVKETGRKIALERALWGWDRGARAEAWRVYRDRVPKARAA